MTARREWAVVLVVAVLWAYRGIWSAGFVYEDANWLPVARVWWVAPMQPSLLGYARQVFSSVIYLPWRMAQAIGDGSPTAYHGVALLGHAVNGALLWWLMRRRLGEGAAWIATALFLLHPINTEAVAYVTGGREVFATFWVLLGILAGDGHDRVGWRVAGVLLCTAIAMQAKSSAIAALLLIPYGICLLDRAWVVWSAAPFALLTVGVLAADAVRYVLRLEAREGILYVGPSHLLTWVGVTSASLWRHLALVVVPIGFSIDRDWRGLATWVPPVALVALFAALIVLWRVRQRWPLGLLAAGWILLALAPRFLIQQEEVLNAHQVYLPFLAVWAGLGALLAPAFSSSAQLEGL